MNYLVYQLDLYPLKVSLKKPKLIDSDIRFNTTYETNRISLEIIVLILINVNLFYIEPYNIFTRFSHVGIPRVEEVHKY